MYHIVNITCVAPNGVFCATTLFFFKLPNNTAAPRVDAVQQLPRIATRRGLHYKLQSSVMYVKAMWLLGGQH
jgi:hypothetical protein